MVIMEGHTGCGLSLRLRRNNLARISGTGKAIRQFSGLSPRIPRSDPDAIKYLALSFERHQISLVSVGPHFVGQAQGISLIGETAQLHGPAG